VNLILLENKASFHTEQQEVLQAGLETADYVHTDDTAARHQGQNGYCTVIGNDLFTHFSSTQAQKSGKLSADEREGSIRTTCSINIPAAI
jgi:hypothetical protein